MTKLAAFVHINGRAYGPDDTVPEDVAKRITNPKAWASGTAGTASAPAVPEPPTPAPAAPSAPSAPVQLPDGEPDEEWTVRELRDYAKSKNITLGEAKTKPAILELLGAAPAQGGTEVTGADEGNSETASGGTDSDPETETPAAGDPTGE